MTTGAAAERPRSLEPADRRWIALAGVLLLVLAISPPLSGLAQGYLFAEALRFSLLAVGVPALLTMGSPWALVKLADRPRRGGIGPAADDDVAATAAGRPFDHLAAGRRRHPEFVRAMGYLAVDVAVMVAWRTPDAVNALHRHRWLLAAEALTLVAAGIGLWLELVESPPLTPRVERPWRAVLAAFAMWSIWVVAYLVGLSYSDWYRSFSHHAGGLSAVADQQFSTVVLWTVAALFFVPVVFWNLMIWLRSPDDPDVELRRLVRDDQRLGPPAPRQSDSTGQVAPPA